MKILIIIKLFLILTFPFLLFLLALNSFAFNDGFYQNEFSKLNVEKEVPNAGLLHRQVIDFLKGDTEALPNDFNEREKSHLSDVRKLAKNASRSMYLFIILLVLLSFASLRIIGNRKHFMNFMGRVFVRGGILSVALSIILLLSASLGFSDAFDSFHRLFFTQGTYVFDPANELIVRLYPEQLFMDLGIKILGLFLSLSIFTMILGGFLTAGSKKNK